MSANLTTIIEYINQNRQIYTREAITSQLVSAGYNPSEVEAAWGSVDSGVPAPPSGYAGAAGLSGGSWDSGSPEQSRPQRLMSSPAFWGYMAGFVLLSYILPGGLFWLGTSNSDGLIMNIAIGMFLLLQLGALMGGVVSLSRNRPRGVGLLTGVLMTLVVLPVCAFAVFFGMCLASFGTMGTI